MPQLGALQSPPEEIAAAPHVREALAPTAIPVPANFHSPQCDAHVTIDQDPFGACVPFGGAYIDAGLEFLDEKRQLNPGVLDPLHAYAEIKGLPWPLTDPAQDPSPGMYPTQLWAYTQTTGWPTKDGSPRRKTAAAYNIGVPSSDPAFIADLQQTILQFGPVLVTASWPGNWFGTDPNGFLPAPQPNPTEGHAHEVCGWITVNGRLYATGHMAWGDWEPDIIPDYPNHFYVDVTYWDGLGWEAWKVIDVTGDNQQPSPPVSTLYGVDVSQYQGAAINWTQVKGAGVSFALIRASVGNTIIDPDYAVNVKGARAAGIIPVAYHWLGHGNPTGDLDNFIKAIGSPAGLIIAIDVEQTTPAANTAADVTGFLDAWHARYPDQKIFVYSGEWFWPGHIGISVAGHPAVAGNWNSFYINGMGGTSPQSLYPGDTWAGWTPGYGGFTSATVLQFTDLASVPGIPGSVDADAFRGTLADLQKFVGSAPVGYNQTIKMFSGPLAYHIAAGTMLNSYDPNKPNTVISHQTFAAETDGHADAEVWVDWQGANPAPVPRGGPFLRVTDGPFAAGLLIVEALVTRDPDPIAGQIADLQAKLAATQADLDTANGQLNQAKAAAKVITSLAS